MEYWLTTILLVKLINYLKTFMISTDEMKRLSRKLKIDEMTVIREFTQYPFSFKERSTLIGKTFLLIAEHFNFKANIFVKLNFLMREKVLGKTTDIIRRVF